MIPRPDYEALIAARRTLSEMSEAMREAASNAGDAIDALFMGSMAQACDAGADAVFNVLNCAQVAFGDREAEAAARAHWDRAVVA